MNSEMQAITQIIRKGFMWEVNIQERGTKMKYEFAKNGKSCFSQEEINNDQCLAHIARQIGCAHGELTVVAENRDEAFKKFFGISPDDSVEYPKEVVPNMYTYESCEGEGWATNPYSDEGYGINPV